MHWWTVGLVANALISVAYFAIVAFIVVPLVRSRQLTKNKLGAATAAIFLTSAVHHGVHALHVAVPSVGIDVAQGLAMRDAWGWELALWDLVGAVVAAYYFGLRRTYGSLMQGAQLFDDLRRRERQALELNDNVLQGLVVAKMALELDRPETARAALDTSIASASQMISGLLAATGDRPVAAGLLRSHPAALHPAAGWSEPGPSSSRRAS